jgi:peptidoglycan L-alanyl-D-glutamate endopeptidase CwlK
MLDAKSRKRLEGVHPDLVKVIEAADEMTPLEFIVTEGVRTLARQQQLVAAGASKTLKSRHLTGHAVDLAVKVNGEVRWDWGLYVRLAETVKAAAAKVGIPITAGIDWKMRDGPHYELSWKAYPAKEN